MNQGKNPLICEFLKKLTKFVISFSLLSFLFLNPSCLPFFLHAFVSHATDKNYIFLLCNGIILVFIAKCTYSCRTLDTQLPLMETIPDHNHDLIFEQPLMEKSSMEEDDVEEEQRSEAGEEVGQFLITDGDGILDDDHDHDHDHEDYMNEELENGSYIEEEEEEEDDDGGEIAKMSTEELNRKFEDFIRKMKEELRIEAQQQLIVV